MIGSTAIFSMKTAGLVWLLVGFLKFNEGTQAKQPQRLSLATNS
jgi:putative polymerase